MIAAARPTPSMASLAALLASEFGAAVDRPGQACAVLHDAEGRELLRWGIAPYPSPACQARGLELR
jgi:hypothetical protein